jgi:cyclophilin family peptidyl-prolyl cis-trans isomerase
MPTHDGLARVLGYGLGLLLPLSGYADEGIFAEFTTSMGLVRCQLDYERSPRAVANFIALATGNRPWMEETSGQVREDRFYDGLTFHRVIQGFMIQGGSPNGQGTDGPGYVFPDAFDAALRHDGPGTLSMANSGPNSNGSQFFITVAATPWLDDVHTVFGRVTEGADVVQSISEVDTDDQNRPREPVWLHGIVIDRVGVAAEAFDIHAQGLPEVVADGLSVQRNGAGLTLSLDRPAHADLRLRESSNLDDWTSRKLGIDLERIPDGRVDVAAPGSTGFFALTRIQYATSTFTPRVLANRSLRIRLEGDEHVLALFFDDDGGGVYTYGSDHGGTITSWNWVQEVYRGRLSVTTSDLVPMMFRLDFSSEEEGKLSGTLYAEQPFAVTGSFTLDPIALDPAQDATQRLNARPN